MACDGLPHVVRFRIVSGTFQYQDAVQGLLLRRVQAMDQLLLRPDFMPTSFFANIVDNHTLCSSHYVVSSSRDFFQLPVYNALQWVPPVFINIGNLTLRSGPRLLMFNNARSYVRTYSAVPELSILNFLLAGRGLKRSDVGRRMCNINEMIANFDISTISSNTLLLNTYKLMKPERLEAIQEQQLELDEVSMYDMMNDNFFEDMQFTDPIPKGL